MRRTCRPPVQYGTGAVTANLSPPELPPNSPESPQPPRLKIYGITPNSPESPQPPRLKIHGIAPNSPDNCDRGDFKNV